MTNAPAMAAETTSEGAPMKADGVLVLRTSTTNALASVDGNCEYDGHRINNNKRKRINSGRRCIGVSNGDGE